MYGNFNERATETAKIPQVGSLSQVATKELGRFNAPRCRRNWRPGGLCRWFCWLPCASDMHWGALSRVLPAIVLRVHIHVRVSPQHLRGNPHVAQEVEVRVLG